MTQDRNRICIAILALGGQGGGVLADWIQQVARKGGWIAQGTSVPGVAQRTGSTVYYVELHRATSERRPIMAQMPAPGDVDVVVASELMETGRALVRGFVSDRTTLIGSTHRIYAISEKSAMGDGRGDGDRVIKAADERAKRFIGFDMEAATERSNSVISSIMFGALAGSDALPFPREAFEDAIRASGIAVDSNLKGFAEGYEAARGPVAKPHEPEIATPEPSTDTGRAMRDRIIANLPPAAHAFAAHGVQKLLDYQGTDYARLYLTRLEAIALRDPAPHELTREVARHLALWMGYEDTIRVAALKIRDSRSARVRDEVRVGDGQLLAVTEFMHPRLREVCETLPAPLARALLKSKLVNRLTAPLFNKGRHVETTSVRWFAALAILAAMRPMRPSSLRYVEEQERIEAWLGRISATVQADNAMAIEIARCQRVIKGYGDTFERGLHNFARLMERLDAGGLSAEGLGDLRQAAMADDQGKTLDAALLASAPSPAVAASA